MIPTWRWLFVSLVVVFLLPSSVHNRIIYKPSSAGDCGGQNSVITFIDASISPDPVLNPGDALINTEMRVRHNISLQNVRAKLSLTKLEPRRMRVPCFRRFGSCGYDACQMIRNNPGEFCPIFPKSVTCGCELVQGTYYANDSTVSLPRFGPIIRRVMQGNYEGNLTFFTPNNRVLGCLKLEFAIKNHST